MVQIRINKDIGQTFNKMNEVKILGENINIAERENFESGNVLLNFNTCAGSRFFLSFSVY